MATQAQHAIIHIFVEQLMNTSYFSRTTPKNIYRLVKHLRCSYSIMIQENEGKKGKKGKTETSNAESIHFMYG